MKLDPLKLNTIGCFSCLNKRVNLNLNLNLNFLEHPVYHGQLLLNNTALIRTWICVTTLDIPISSERIISTGLIFVSCGSENNSGNRRGFDNVINRYHLLSVFSSTPLYNSAEITRGLLTIYCGGDLRN